MCGLFGCSYVSPLDRERVRRARDRLAHRGPDHAGEWMDERVYLGHRRLSILDLSSLGHQPMATHDGAVVVAVNGEIYNYRALRAALEARHDFRSGSDSEVALHGYVEWGIDGLVERLEGMYAFALYDRARQRIHLVRDRVGIKPLYYAIIDDQLVWGSELKALQIYLPPEALNIDVSALYDFLTYRYVPTPKTPYKEVRKLPPAHHACFELSTARFTTTRYWDLPEGERLDPPEPGAALADALVEAVDAQMVADVPVGFFLSGGVDSAAVVSIAAGSHAQPTTFTIGFDVDRRSEVEAAAFVARRFGTDHVARTLTEAQAVELAEAMRDWFDEPFADTSALPQYLVSQLASERVRVVLSGDGGDEVFGGYSWYAPARRRIARETPALDGIRGQVARWTANAPAAARRAMRGVQRYLLLEGYEHYTRLLGGLIAGEKTHYRQQWEIPADYDDYWYFRSNDDRAAPPVSRLQRLDFRTFLHDDVLTKVDRTSMANSLEVRVPLLATPIVEFSFSLAEAVRLPGGRPKGLLKDALRGRLPDTVLERPKRGFGVPAHVWRAGPFDRRLTRQEHILRRHFPGLVVDVS